jgi:hypothetical protein
MQGMICTCVQSSKPEMERLAPLVPSACYRSSPCRWAPLVFELPADTEVGLRIHHSGAVLIWLHRAAHSSKLLFQTSTNPQRLHALRETYVCRAVNSLSCVLFQMHDKEIVCRAFFIGRTHGKTWKNAWQRSYLARVVRKSIVWDLMTIPGQLSTCSAL